MISRLAPMLQTPPRHARLIERLDFRCDLPRGSKKIIYQELGALLARPDIMARGFRKNDLIRWLVEHSNLNTSFASLKTLLLGWLLVAVPQAVLSLPPKSFFDMLLQNIF